MASESGIEKVLATLAETLDGRAHRLDLAKVRDFTGTGRLAYTGLPKGQSLGDVGPSVTGKFEDRSVPVIPLPSLRFHRLAASIGPSIVSISPAPSFFMIIGEQV